MFLIIIVFTFLISMSEVTEEGIPHALQVLIISRIASLSLIACLQCFFAVGWAAGRASSLWYYSDVANNTGLIAELCCILTVS